MDVGARVGKRTGDVEINVTLYSLPHDVCFKCGLTAHAFEKAGIEHTTVELLDHPELVEKFRGRDLMSAPIVEVELGDGAVWRWCDFRRDDIKKLAELVAGVDPELAAA